VSILLAYDVGLIAPANLAFSTCANELRHFRILALTNISIKLIDRITAIEYLNFCMMRGEVHGTDTFTGQNNFP